MLAKPKVDTNNPPSCDTTPISQDSPSRFNSMSTKGNGLSDLEKDSDASAGFSGKDSIWGTYRQNKLTTNAGNTTTGGHSSFFSKERNNQGSCKKRLFTTDASASDDEDNRETHELDEKLTFKDRIDSIIGLINQIATEHRKTSKKSSSPKKIAKTPKVKELIKEWKDLLPWQKSHLLDIFTFNPNNPHPLENPPSPLPQEVICHLMGYYEHMVQFEVETKLMRKMGLKQRLGHKAKKVLIAMNAKDISDQEVIDSIELILKQHGPENCVIASSQGAVDKILQEHPIDTVATIGHGFTRTDASNFYCGPMVGLHDDIVDTWAKIIIQHSSVKQLKIFACFYGKANPDFDPQDGLSRFVIKQDATHTLENGRAVGLGVCKEGEPIPFAEDSFAGMLWKKIVGPHPKRDFALTATPMILNPLPVHQPAFFAACDNDHYLHGAGSSNPMWEHSDELRPIDKLKTITLCTENSTPFARQLRHHFQMQTPADDMETAVASEHKPPVNSETSLSSQISGPKRYVL